MQRRLDPDEMLVESGKTELLEEVHQNRSYDTSAAKMKLEMWPVCADLSGEVLHTRGRWVD